MDGLSISRTTRQYGNFSERHSSRNFFFKSAGDNVSVDVKNRLLMVGLASFKNAERPWPLDWSESGPGRRDISSSLTLPFTTMLTFSARTPSSSTEYAPSSGVPLNSFALGSSVNETLVGKTRAPIRPTQSL